MCALPMIFFVKLYHKRAPPSFASRISFSLGRLLPLLVAFFMVMNKKTDEYSRSVAKLREILKNCT